MGGEVGRGFEFQPRAVGSHGGFKHEDIIRTTL
jgi:predicted RNA binding protein YcfA (HicA-like mRNA interferase family)